MCMLFFLSLLFWSDWYEHYPKIEVSWMDGHRRDVLISSEIVWPNALTLDLARLRVYWVDAKLNRIESADYDGEHRWGTNRGHSPGVGGTKPIFAVLLFFQVFRIIKTPVNYWIPNSYLTGFAAAWLWWYLSNMNVIWWINFCMIEIIPNGKMNKLSFSNLHPK